MSVTVKDVARIARLARLEFSDAAMERFTHQLNRVLDYMTKLNALDTSSVEPLSYIIDPGPAGRTSMRDDVVAPSLERGEALKNSPATDDEYFKVPKVVDK